MDYKEKYEQALERAKTLYNSVFVNNDILEQIFPELEESEDERMRKQLLNWFKDCSWDTIDDGNLKREDIIAWLEKQGEQKSTDKVEPKFKVGDWVVYCNEDVDFIMGVGKTGYIINKGGGYIPFVCENDMHIWTIQDAKDGDVLATDTTLYIFKYCNGKNLIKFYCSIPVDGTMYEWNFKEDECYTDIYVEANIHPATKEQCDLLFQKMKEAGYKWDAEKKELKKIKQKLVEWSEEDEKEGKRVVGLLEGWLYTFKETCYAEDCKCGIAWLKSLKERMEV